MAKRSYDVDEREQSEQLESFGAETSHPTRLVLLKDVNLKIKGVSGKTYVFRGAGSVVEVSPEDVLELLNRKRTSCCTGAVSRYFEIYNQ